MCWEKKHNSQEFSRHVAAIVKQNVNQNASKALQYFKPDLNPNLPGNVP